MFIYQFLILRYDTHKCEKEAKGMKKWKLIKENEYENDVNGEYYINTYACPSCNWKVRTEGEMEYRFCPMCGEDLRGK